MKLDEGDGIVGVQLCTEKDDVLLTTRGGKCIRFAADRRARVQGPRIHRRARHQARPKRATTSWSAWRCSAIPMRTTAEARAYLKQASAARRAAMGEGLGAEDNTPADDDGGRYRRGGHAVARTLCRAGRARTVRAGGFRARLRQAHLSRTNTASPAAAARASWRWGCRKKNNAIVAAFPVEESDHLMLITNTGQTIRTAGRRRRRCRAARRSGVTLFRMDENERVVVGRTHRRRRRRRERRRANDGKAHRALSGHLRSGDAGPSRHHQAAR